MAAKGRGDFTITVTRAGELHGRSFRFSVKNLTVLFLVVLALGTFCLFSSLHYFRMWEKSADFTVLERELDTLRKQDDSFRHSARQLSDQLASLEVTAEKLRIASGYKEDGLGGVGGPARTRDPILSLTQNDLLKHFRSLDRKRISLEAEFQQIQDYFTTREILIAAMPSLMPVRGYPSDAFGNREDPFDRERNFHPGIDISAPRGAKVVASADGMVVFAGRRLGYGKLVSIEHKFGISTRYGHLDRYTVKPGQKVKKGDLIGYVGSTGRATGPHLHYEVRLNDQPLNPARFFRESL